MVSGREPVDALPSPSKGQEIISQSSWWQPLGLSVSFSISLEKSVRQVSASLHSVDRKKGCIVGMFTNLLWIQGDAARDETGNPCISMASRIKLGMKCYVIVCWRKKLYHSKFTAILWYWCCYTNFRAEEMEAEFALLTIMRLAHA